jgi:hypothetical protein
MKQILVLNSVSDADHCIEKEFYRDSYILSTNASVNFYLKDIYNVDSECISSFFTNAEICEYRNILSGKVDNILSTLDENIAPLINKKLSLNMRYFWPLYSYYGKHHITALFFFVEGLKRAIDAYGSEKILIYNRKLNDFMNGVSDIKVMVSTFFDEVETEIISFKQLNERQSSFSNSVGRLVDMVIHRPGHIIRRIEDLIDANIRFRFFPKKRRTILLYGHLYDLSFLTKKLKGYNVFYYLGSTFCRPIGVRKGNSEINVDVDFQDFDFIKEKTDPLIDTLLADIEKDFRKNIRKYISAIFSLESAAERYPISLAIWGNPPVSGTKALIFEYLSSKGVTVLGGQHGCLYGEANVPWHFDSDFNRCDYFISYGFTEADVSRIYPDKKATCIFLPFGANQPISSSRKKEIGILFPITNSMSIFYGGMSRISPEKLARRQVELLEYLNSLSDCKIVVKPFLYSSFDNLAPLVRLGELTRCKMVNKVTLKEFLQKYSPRAVLIEYPSQPLFDCLHLDAEIFLMNDPVNPYEKKALELLRKRVHYAESVEEIIEKINMFLNGKLEKRRDDSFYKHYVYKEHRKERILRQIDELVQSSLGRC